MAGGYADTRADYTPADTQGEAIKLVRHAGMYAAQPGSHVYAGTRQPWSEGSDPYPDYTVTLTPRGRYVWSAA